MGIVYKKDLGIINLHTKNSTYQMKIDKYNNLLHTYYGSRIDDTDMSVLIFRIDRGFSGNTHEVGKLDRSYSLDVLPQEYSSFGTGDFRISALKIKNADGSRASSLVFKDCKIEKGLYKIDGLPAIYSDENKGESLCVTLVDEVTNLHVELWYGVLEENDIIVRSVKLFNKGKEEIQIEKAASLNLDILYGDYDLITFYGRHAMERNVDRRNIPHGTSSVGSVRGTSSHHYHPAAIICEKTATETSGECFGASFMYSGEFLIEVEKEQTNQVRLICGIHPDDFSWQLEAGTKLELPQVMMTYSNEGLGKLSRNYHKTIRENVCRGEWKNKRRPVLINNWEATYFDFTGDKLADIAKTAHDLGIELFVMDDGWFGKRNDDNSGLGDWFPNEKKLGCTLKELGEKIENTGMLFGIWFEPEAISEDSDLYRAHPDWAISVPGREPALSRNELLLDFSRTEVCDYITERISTVLKSAPISYVKWDMNRSMCDKYSHALDAKHQGEFAHRYILGLYSVLEKLLKEFPHVLFEGCSGGGGRFDAGMMFYTPQIWCSDNTDAINRSKIQYGTSFAYPVSVMGAHVSAVPNHQTGRVTPLNTRGAVAMAGTFGYELDITKMTAEEKEEIKKQITTFHKFYDLIQYGEYYRLSTPKDMCTAWEIVSLDQSKALITGVFKDVEGNQCPTHIKVFGLCPDKKYNIEIVNTDVKYEMSGIALLNAGLTFPYVKEDNQAIQIYIYEAK